MIDAELPGQVEIQEGPSTDGACDPFDHVAEEFLQRCRRGESPSISEYATRYPEHAQAIRKLLPSVAMMEQLKRRQWSLREREVEPAPTMPERLGEFRLVRELGRGGMGIVYEAVQESLDRTVALKVIPHHSLLDVKRRERFRRESLAVAQLHHTNIVPIFAVGEHGGLPYFAMQYIRGSGLDRWVEAWRTAATPRGVDHWRFVARVGVQAAEALAYAHEQGILHRDVKPANLLVDEHQVVWITDFGLAKLAGRDDLTRSGDVIGTLRYLAPEALRGETDHRSDIYSLGLTLYELLTLHPPFGDLTPSELLRCVTEEQPTRPRKLDLNIPRDLETIVLKATAREPEHRYATPGALAEDLRAFLDDRPILARRATPAERLARWCRRNRAVAALTAAVVLWVLVALVVGWVGYASTTRALERAKANVALSLTAFEDLFETLTEPWDLGPFGGEPAGPPGGAGRPTPDRQAGPPGGPPELGTGPPEHKAAILASVLAFYDKFAAENQTDSPLQGEAARAHRKVAALYRSLGHDEEANAAHARATETFEQLVARNPEVPEYRYELARTYALDDQHAADSTPPPEMVQRLHGALKLVQRLDQESPRSIKYVAALARWKAQLGAALQQLRRPEEALPYYRESIAHDEWLAEHVPDPAGVRWVLGKNQGAVAQVLLQLGRRDEAKGVLDRAAATLAMMAAENPTVPGTGRPATECLTRMAEAYQSLGETGRAAEFSKRAETLHARRGPGYGRDRGRASGFPHARVGYPPGPRPPSSLDRTPPR
jgi:tetratricopeptide (TPR) repeat protein